MQRTQFVSDNVLSNIRTNAPCARQIVRGNFRLRIAAACSCLSRQCAPVHTATCIFWCNAPKHKSHIFKAASCKEWPGNHLETPLLIYRSFNFLKRRVQMTRCSNGAMTPPPPAPPPPLIPRASQHNSIASAMRTRHNATPCGHGCAELRLLSG